MYKMDSVKVGLVGCGNRGRGHLRVLKEFEDVDLVGVCDLDAKLRGEVCEELGIEGQYGDLVHMLETAGLDAVFVTTPPHLNARLALPCLEAGIDTFIEKPPGLSVEETEGLKAAADRTGAKAMVGWNRRFHPIILSARDTVQDQGPITQLVGEFHKSITDHEKNPKMAEAIMDCLLLETPIHAIDTIRFLANSEVAEVHSIVRRSMSNYRDVHAALIGFENGAVAQVSHNYTTSARLERYEIHGHEISAYMEGVSSGHMFFEGEKREIAGSSSDSTVDQNRFFIDCVKEDRSIELPAANLDEAIKTMKLCEAIMAGTK